MARNNDNVFDSKQLARIEKSLSGRRIWVPIKRLLGIIDMARQVDPAHRADKFVMKLEDEGCIEMKGAY